MGMPAMHRFLFQAPIELLDFGRMAYSVIYVPEELKGKLPKVKGGRLRIQGSIEDEAFHGAIQPAGGGELYIHLSKQKLKRIGREVGSQVTVAFDVADHDAVDVPEELELALERRHKAKAAWEALTPGKRRGLAYRVAIAKRPATRARRIEEPLEDLVDC